MKRIAFLSIFLCTVMSQSVLAAGGKVFAEFGLGIGFADTDLEFENPVGTAFTTSATSGSKIILSNTDDDDDAFTVYAGLGYNLTENYFIKASYRHFGDIKTSGDVVFAPTTFTQTLSADAEAFFLGIGGRYDMTESIFFEATVDLGFADIDSDGTQGVAGAFPEDSHSDFAWGIGGGLGYKLTQNVHLLANVNYHELGDADTGTTGTPPPAGMNAGERLETDLNILSATINIRYSF